MSPRRVAFSRSQALALAVLGMAAMVSGCSGFATGGVATASASGERVDIRSRTGTASIGPTGPQAVGTHQSTTLCVDPATGATRAC